MAVKIFSRALTKGNLLDKISSGDFYISDEITDGIYCCIICKRSGTRDNVFSIKKGSIIDHGFEEKYHAHIDCYQKEVDLRSFVRSFSA